MDECFECGETANNLFSDIEYIGDLRCDKCHLVHLEEKATELIQLMHDHVKDQELEYDFMDLLP